MTTTNPMGSGNEVESAAFHVPVSGVTSAPSRTGFRGRMDNLKSRGLEKVHDVQRAVGVGRDSVKTSLLNAKVSVREGASDSMTKVQTSMKANPMLWAGIAAGSGFVLGLAGRIADARKKSRRMMPDLVIIDTTC
jgi:hypothetical protein